MRMLSLLHVPSHLLIPSPFACLPGRHSWLMAVAVAVAVAVGRCFSQPAVLKAYTGTSQCGSQPGWLVVSTGPSWTQWGSMPVLVRDLAP